MHPLDEDDDEQDGGGAAAGGRANDPYGSLGQFGNAGAEAEMGYAADAPAPRRMGGGKEEDLLF